MITVRKQLSNTVPKYKCLGMLGGCCLLGRIGARAALARRAPAPFALGSDATLDTLGCV